MAGRKIKASVLQSDASEEEPTDEDIYKFNETKLFIGAPRIAGIEKLETNVIIIFIAIELCSCYIVILSYFDAMSLCYGLQFILFKEGTNKKLKLQQN